MKRLILTVVLVLLLCLTAHAMTFLTGETSTCTYWLEDKTNPYYPFYQKYFAVHIVLEPGDDFFNMFHTNIGLDIDCPCSCFCH